MTFPNLRKVVLVQLLLLAFAYANAQITVTHDYAFSSSLTFYNEINDGIDSGLATDWLNVNSDFSAVPPFDFEVFGKPVFGLTSYFTPSLLYFVPEDETDVDFLFFRPFGFPQLQNRAMANGSEASDISTITTGEVGERITKIQYRNAGFAAEIDSLGTSEDFINFQVWLHESTNAIEIHYGAWQIANENIAYGDAAGPSVGLFMIEAENIDSDQPSVSLFLENNPMNPDTVRETSNVNTYQLDGMPPTGMIYRLLPQADTTTTDIDTTTTTNIYETVWEKGISVFPNPSTESINLSLENETLLGAQYILTDSKGRNFASGLVFENVEISLSTLPAGVYFLRLQKGERGLVKRVIKR